MIGMVLNFQFIFVVRVLCVCVCVAILSVLDASLYLLV